MTETTDKIVADANTGAGLMEFLDVAKEKGWLNPNSAQALRTASQQILSIDSGWEDTDLRTVDVEALFERFRNLRRNKYSDDSMRVYKTRFTQALRMHLARLDDDPQWKSYGPTGRTNGTGVKKAAPKKGTPRVEQVEDALPTPETHATASVIPQQGATRTPLMQFPYPLRDNLDVHLNLPRDLTKSEAERLCRFIGTLAREEQRAITAGD